MAVAGSALLRHFDYIGLLRLTTCRHDAVKTNRFDS